MEKILTIEQIFKPGNTIQLSFSEYLGQIRSFSGVVNNFSEDGLLISTGVKDLGELPVESQEIIIQYENPEGTQYLFNTYRITKIKKDVSTLICAKPWKMNSSMQYRYLGPQVEAPWKIHSTSLRRYFRMKTDFPFFYMLDEIIHVGRVMDLSLSGLFAVVYPDPRLILQSILIFQIQLPQMTPIELKGEIVRSQTIENTKMGIALNFIDVPMDKRQILASSIQELQ